MLEVHHKSVDVIQHISVPVLLNPIPAVDSKCQLIRELLGPFFETIEDPPRGQISGDRRTGNFGQEAHTR